MDPSSQMAFFNEYEQKRKSVAVGYLTWLIGFHYLYARKVGVQFAFWLTAGGFWIWYIADLFRLPAIIRSANEQIARQSLQTLSITAFSMPQQPGLPLPPAGGVAQY